MATRTWLGASADWNSTSNWSGGAVPVDGDDVVFNSGSQNATTNLDQSAVNLGSLSIFAGYTGNVGATGAGNQLKVSVSGAGRKVTFQGSGKLYIGYAGETLTQVVVDTDSTNSPSVTIVDGTTTELVLQKGIVEVAAGTLTTLQCGYRTSPSSDATLTIGASMTFTTANVTGGTINASTQPTTLNQDAGVWNVVAGSGSTTVNLRGGTFNWNYSGQTITTLNVYNNATFDGTGINAASTITTLNIYSASATVDLRSGTKISAATIYPYINNPQLYVDGGRKISLA